MPITVCAHCGEEFEAARKTARYCKAVCRSAAHKAKRRENGGGGQRPAGTLPMTRETLGSIVGAAFEARQGVRNRAAQLDLIQSDIIVELERHLGSALALDVVAEALGYDGHRSVESLLWQIEKLRRDADFWRGMSANLNSASDGIPPSTWDSVLGMTDEAIRTWAKVARARASKQDPNAAESAAQWVRENLGAARPALASAGHEKAAG